MPHKLSIRFSLILLITFFLNITVHIHPTAAKEPLRIDKINFYGLNQLKEASKVQNVFKVLVYDETSGFTHVSRDAARVMFNELGEAHGFEVEFDRSGDAFNSLENLQNYAVVVFSNTSGNEILNDDQKINFENYIKGGGGFLGIHAATDTYRTGWDWYRDLVGGSVRTNPNHTDQDFPGTMDVLDHDHPSTSQVPDPWSRNEEWYYWKGGGGYLFSGNIDLLQLRETGDNDYDEARPISWYKEYDGGRSFYTAMGHDNDAYDEEHFRNHVLGAIQWLTEEIHSPSEPIPPSLDPIENPEPIAENAGVQIITLKGISAGSGDDNNLTITATSDNPDLIPDPEITFDNASNTATLSFQPEPNSTGTATITVTLNNGEESNNTATRTFNITVVDVDQPLTVSEIDDQVIQVNEEVGPIEFNIFYEGDDEITISISSDNPDVVPSENVNIDGSGSERTITLVPTSGRSGTANITITVSAGEYEVEQHFKVEVLNITNVTSNQHEKDFVLFYPNPVENEISLNLVEGMYDISLHDIAGKNLIFAEIYKVEKNHPIKIPIVGLVSGIYILIINGDNFVLKNKVLIK